MTPPKVMRAPQLGGGREFAIPRDWVTAPVINLELVVSLETPDGAQLHVGGGVLQDQTVIAFLSYPGGVRWLRARPETDFAAEERETGAPPRPQHRPAVDQGWRATLEVNQRANARAKETERRIAGMSEAAQREASLSLALRQLAKVAHSVAHHLADPDCDDEGRDEHCERLAWAATAARAVGATDDELRDQIRGAAPSCSRTIQTVLESLSNSAVDAGVGEGGAGHVG